MKTIAIVDFAHSGTTMLAGILEILGVPMVGARYKENKWEDQEIISALNHEDEFAELVSRRNIAHSVWGFKYPGAWKFEPLLSTYLRNPIYFSIYKDPVSVSGRRFGSITVNKTLNTIIQMKKSIEGIKDTELDVHLLSYQSALISPVDFVAEVASIIDICPTPDQLRKSTQFIRPNAGSPRSPYPEIKEYL